MEFANYPSLKQRTVYITGGASGIGAEMVRAFAAQGAKVGFLDMDRVAGNALLNKLEGKHAFLRCDLRDIEALQAAFATLADDLGPAKVLVNNAANDTRHDLDSYSVEEWDKGMNVNLRPHFFTAQTAAPGMKAAGGGAIVNMGSTSWMTQIPSA